MYEKKTNKIEHRIVSIHQPYIRSMIRGKKWAKVEFNLKIIVSRIEGYHIIEKISWNNINEAKFLQKQIERYKLRTGYYSEAVLTDQIFERHIRFAGKRLSRKKQEEIDKKIVKQDQSMRNAIEGFFRVIKRKNGLDRLMNKLIITSETTISLYFFKKCRNLNFSVNPNYLESKYFDLPLTLTSTPSITGRMRDSIENDLREEIFAEVLTNLGIKKSSQIVIEEYKVWNISQNKFGIDLTFYFTKDLSLNRGNYVGSWLTIGTNEIIKKTDPYFFSKLNFRWNNFITKICIFN